jgi:hypothetical protein
MNALFSPQAQQLTGVKWSQVCYGAMQAAATAITKVLVFRLNLDFAALLSTHRAGWQRWHVFNYWLHSHWS